MTPEIQSHQEAFGRLKKRTIMMNNFLGGMAWGIGTVIGASVVVGATGYVLNKLGILSTLGALFGQ